MTKAIKTEIADMRADLMEEIGFVNGKVEDLNEQVEFLMDEIDGLQWTMKFQENRMNSNFTSPIFAAEFSDGTKTRMTTHRKENGDLDLERGIHLARAAYELRRKQPPPALVKGHFESPPGDDKGKILKAYTTKELNP